MKPAAVGKSRLRVPGVDRSALARAIALDTIGAAASARRVAEVIVVTDDEDIRDALSPGSAGRPGDAPRGHRVGAGRVRVLAEGEVGGLNAAVRAGLATVAGDRPRAALLGDLPALRPRDLDAALRAADRAGCTVVADAEGTGSTLVTATAGRPLEPAFGEHSFSRHGDAGFVPVDVPPESTLRRDVDTPAQLDAARALGLGPRTTAVLAAAEHAAGRA